MHNSRRKIEDIPTRSKNGTESCSLALSLSYFIDLSLLGNASQHPTPSSKHMQPAHDAFRIIISVVNIIRQTA